MAETCDLCDSAALELAYVPEATRRGLSIHICNHCGLVQSLPRIDRTTREVANVSSGADWGNVRYGKGFRTAAHSALFGSLGLLGHPRILDVGANRGSFIDAALAAWPNTRITAIEPDGRVTAPYEGRANVTLLRRRIEEAPFEPGTFDLIYSSHTLEHLKSPRATLLEHAKALAPGGRLLLEVPDISIIGSHDIVEEWFIDKHLTHFSGGTLCTALAAADLEIVRGPIATGREYLTVIAKPSGMRPAPVAADPAEVLRAHRLINDYQAQRSANVGALKAAAATLMAERGRVVVWGAGRLFDALVRVGGLDPRTLSGLIDEGLRATHTNERHGLKLLAADDLASAGPDLVVIASRSFASEIQTKAKRLAPTARFVTFSELIEQSSRAA